MFSINTHLKHNPPLVPDSPDQRKDTEKYLNIRFSISLCIQP